MKISFIVCAAGRGERAGFSENKLLAPLYGAPVIYHTVNTINRLIPLLKDTEDELAELIVTSSPRDMLELTAICAPFGAKIVEGGATRTESVYNGLKHVTGDIVLIQDGARPFTTIEQYKACIKHVKLYNSGIVAMPATDTTVMTYEDCIAHVYDRKTVFNIQTPQGFIAEGIKLAYDRAMDDPDGKTYTDDSSLYSFYVSNAYICPCGTAENRKLTFADDFKNSPESFMQFSGNSVGFGVDVHAFGKEQPFVTLCGVKIPCDTGLIAHSDGDVAVHAVMDAVLSAAGLNDIGHYFPDTDEKYREADSCKLLDEVIKIIDGKGLKVSGLSVAIQAEKPRLSQHKDAMKNRLAEITGADLTKISISAGTCEGLGFVGEGRGICAYCTAVLTEIKN
ncbi:MAG: 2-C-methyl-D-erythritol 2,4-cyclodiphosphate synthase [Clostridia bacterium]|nr:2-C-methyl-D-erythritol 2,4-cyclodiphosphate synthase [Clostridia bacterium]